MNIKEEKKALRARIKERREALSKDYMENASRKIAETVTASQWFQSAKVIFAYISMPDEPDTRPVIEAALSAGKTVCVPKCHGKGIMSAVVITSFDDLKPGALNIPEPVNCDNVMDESEIDLGIIPCISANKNGERIGHGAGYYDRFFERSHCRTVCLCFKELMTTEIPMGKHDRRMDCVVTD